MQSTETEKISILNLEQTEWLTMVDDAGTPLHGIVGRAGVVGIVPDAGEIGVDMIRVEPGSAFPLHTHPGAHILYVTEGEGYIAVAVTEYSIRAGDSVFVAAEFPHSVRNPKESNCALTFLAIGMPHKHVGSSERMRVVARESE